MAVSEIGDVEDFEVGVTWFDLLFCGLSFGMALEHGAAHQWGSAVFSFCLAVLLAVFGAHEYKWRKTC